MKGFPRRVYTLDEVQRARKLIERGYRHHLRVVGEPEFKRKIRKILKLLKKSQYFDFFVTYIRAIVEIEGMSQLRETEATIWANIYTLADSVEAAAYFIEKAQRMKNYIDGKQYSEVEEIGTVKKSADFLKSLLDKAQDEALRKRCREVIELLVGSQVL